MVKDIGNGVYSVTNNKTGSTNEVIVIFKGNGYAVLESKVQSRQEEGYWLSYDTFLQRYNLLQRNSDEFYGDCGCVVTTIMPMYANEYMAIVDTYVYLRKKGQLL